MTQHKLPTIAVLASGTGATAEYVLHATQTGVLRANIGLLVCNNAPAGVIRRFRRLNEQHGLDIPIRHISGRTHPGGAGKRSEQTLEEAAVIADLCKDFDLVALLGYMKKVRGKLLDLPVVNFHPGPLPVTAGMFAEHIQERVLQMGLSHSAYTLHWVIEEYDMGEVIAAHKVPVMPGDTPDTLYDAVQATVKTHLPLDLNALLHG